MENTHEWHVILDSGDGEIQLLAVVAVEVTENFYDNKAFYADHVYVSTGKVILDIKKMSS
jgi:hypothetical protein